MEFKNKDIDGIPKDFVCIDLTLGDSVRYSEGEIKMLGGRTAKALSKDFRYEQTKEFLRDMFYKVHKDVVKSRYDLHELNNGDKIIYGDWWVNAVVSCMSLSDGDKGNYSELGKSEGSRLANWHIHAVFYSDDNNTSRLKHIADTYIKKWCSPVIVGKGKEGGYHLGSFTAHRNAIVCDLGRWYYAKFQCIMRMSFDSEKGKLPFKVWDDMILEKRRALLPMQKKILSELIDKWQKRRDTECIDIIQKNYHIVKSSTLHLAKVFATIADIYGTEKACKAFKYIGFSGDIDNDIIQGCFSGLTCTIDWINVNILHRAILNVTLTEDNFEQVVLSELIKGYIK